MGYYSPVSEPAGPIVFAVDFSEMTDFVIEAALVQARMREEAELHAVVVLETRDGLLRADETEYGEELAELEETLEARMAAAFERAGHPLDAPGSWEIEAHARLGSAPRVIADLAREVRADLIVVGRHGHTGPRDLIVGSVPSRLQQLARCSVLIVQPSDYSDSIVDDGEDD